MSKVISKEKLDAAINGARNYYDIHIPTEETDVKAYYELCRAVDPDWVYSRTSDLLATVFAYNSDATNEDVYKVLEVFGWTVTDEGGNEV